jgi:hypothetical protein
MMGASILTDAYYPGRRRGRCPNISLYVNLTVESSFRKKEPEKRCEDASHSQSTSCEMNARYA